MFKNVCDEISLQNILLNMVNKVIVLFTLRVLESSIILLNEVMQVTE